MELIDKKSRDEYWLSDQINAKDYYFYERWYENCWRCAVNIPFDRYDGIAYHKVVRADDLDYMVEFTINGRLIFGNVNFNSNKLTYGLTTTRILWVEIKDGEELELKRQEFLDQQKLNNVVEVNDENLIPEKK